MAFEQRENTGSLFKNDRKEKETHPDYTGKIDIRGEKFWMSAWVKDAGRGKFFSMAFKPVEERPQSTRQADTSVDMSQPPLEDDDLPF